MYLFVGLGNAGEQYENTRHNIGRATLLAAARKFNLPSPTLAPKLQALVSEGKIGKEKIVIVLPETFVNKSGNAVAPAARFYKVKPDRVILLHDDVDMLLGRTKLSFGKNSGGHKGVESVMRALKTKNFWRMRIGVQKKKRVAGENLVLQKFRGEEETVAKKMVKKSLEAIAAIAAAGPERAMNEYNA